MTGLSRSVQLGLLMGWLGCHFPPPEREEPPEPIDRSEDPSDSGASDPAATVILVSLDGYRWDYLDRAVTPVLDRLAQEGARAESLIPVFPTKTFPNHYTQVTGLYPSEHGLIDNSFYDAALGASFSMGNTDPIWWEGEPIWVTAETQGQVAATVFWPGSDVAIGGVRPTHWLPYDGAMSYDARVDQLLEWLDEDPRPSFATLYLSSVDHTGHTYGPGGPEVEAAAASVDATLQRLVTGLEQRELLDEVDLIVVSDHGMAELSRERVVFLDDYVDLDTHGVYSWTTAARIEPPPGAVAQTVAALQAMPHTQCARKEDLPAHLHYADHSRIPPVVCIAESGWAITSRAWFASHPAELTGGTHGWDPMAPDMHGIFVARGPHFGAGTVHPSFEAVHLYPLMAHLLDLEPAPHSGSLDAVRGLLREPGGR